MHGGRPHTHAVPECWRPPAFSANAKPAQRRCRLPVTSRSVAGNQQCRCGAHGDAARACSSAPTALWQRLVQQVIDNPLPTPSPFTPICLPAARCGQFLATVRNKQAMLLCSLHRWPNEPQRSLLVLLCGLPPCQSFQPARSQQNSCYIWRCGKCTITQQLRVVCRRASYESRCLWLRFFASP